MKKSLIVLISILALLVIIIGYGISINNKMVNADEAVMSQWAKVENQYQRRADLIPNLVNTVKGYASHEKETLDAVVNARAKATQVTISPDNLNEASLQKYPKNLHLIFLFLAAIYFLVLFPWHAHKKMQRKTYNFHFSLITLYSFYHISHMACKNYLRIHLILFLIVLHCS